MSDKSAEVPASNLVERLLGWAKDLRLGRKCFGADQDVTEAAATITRLTAEIVWASEVLAGTAVGALPKDYPLERLAIETCNTLQERTLEGLALVGKVEALTAEVERLRAALLKADCYLAQGSPNLALQTTTAAIQETKP